MINAATERETSGARTVAICPSRACQLGVTVARPLCAAETISLADTRKQWGMDPSEFDAAVTARVPVRTNADCRYFTDT